MIEYDAYISMERMIASEEDQQAVSTSWGWAPGAGAEFTLILHREDQSVLATIVYSIDEWADVFSRLCAAYVMISGDAAYWDDKFSERRCDKCGKPYRGPAVYCSRACAEADA